MRRIATAGTGSSDRHPAAQRRRRPETSAANPPRRLPESQREYRSYSGHSAGLVPYGEPVIVDRGFNLPGAVAHSIARALYHNPAPNLAPVGCQSGQRNDIVDVSCERITVVADDDQTLAIARSRGNCDSPAALRQQEFRTTNAQAITAHLTVTYPDDSRRTVDLSLDIFCDDEIYEEAVWLTDAWQPDQIEQLQEILFQAYRYADNPEQCRDPEAYEDEMAVLATRLLADGRPALQAQL